MYNASINFSLISEKITMGIRSPFQNYLDELQFRIDTFPPNGAWSYQPLPWINLDETKRNQGTLMRSRAIEAALADCAVINGMDVGCNIGFFCFNLARKGIPMLGIDMDSRYIRIARYAGKKIGSSSVGFVQMAVNTETVFLLPKVELVLALSIWHHWVKAYGLETASFILSEIWKRCSKVMFFETGENEMTADFNLPTMGDSPQVWLKDYLQSVCNNSEIIHVGQFEAFAPQDNKVVYRNLFKIIRV